MSDHLCRTTGSRRLASASHPFPLELGGCLNELTLAFETYGTLDSSRENVILICHALTGSAFAAGVDESGKRGWWHGLIGPGLAFDTDRYFVVCSNVLGGCYGSTGPTSIDPATGFPWLGSFPAITIRDMVSAQRLLLADLGIERLEVVAGGSMGGMQVLEWALLYPDFVDRIIPIATNATQSPWCIAFSSISREAIALGASAGDVEAGLRLARKVAMLGYRSSRELQQRFGRNRTGEDPGVFEVERYLERHGQALAARFDIETYRTITGAMDLHDITRGRGSIEGVLASIEQPALCVGISSDILYPAADQKELARLLPNARYAEIESICGHDAFLIEYSQINRFVNEFLDENPRGADFQWAAADDIKTASRQSHRLQAGIS